MCVCGRGCDGRCGEGCDDRHVITWVEGVMCRLGVVVMVGLVVIITVVQA